MEIHVQFQGAKNIPIKGANNTLSAKKPGLNIRRTKFSSPAKKIRHLGPTFLWPIAPLQMFDWVENRLLAKGLNIELTLVPSLKIMPKKYSTDRSW